MCYSKFMKQKCFPINEQEILSAALLARYIPSKVSFFNYNLLDTIQKNMSREMVLTPICGVSGF